MTIQFTQGQDKLGYNTLSIMTDDNTEITLSFDGAELFVISVNGHEFEPLDDTLPYLYAFIDKKPISLYNLMIEAIDQIEVIDPDAQIDAQRETDAEQENR